MNRTSIEWTDFSANPVIYRDAIGRQVWGCEKISAGCKNCYAETLAKRWRRGGPFNAPTMRTLTPELSADELWSMATAKRNGGKNIAGSRVFVEDMSDLFGEWVSDVLLDRLMVILALRRDVTWQLLTKRARRAHDYFRAMSAPTAAYNERWDAAREWVRKFLIGRGDRGSMSRAEYVGVMMAHQPWPLPNVWLGVSAENQLTADERIPLLLDTPAAVRWVSYEPALGPVDFKPWLTKRYSLHMSASVDGMLLNRSYAGICHDDGRPMNPTEAEAALRALQANGVKMISCADGECEGFSPVTGCPSHDCARLDWIVVGGESGPGARAFNLAWARSTVKQCRDAGTGMPVFVKQMGAAPFLHESSSINQQGPGFSIRVESLEIDTAIRFADRKGADPDEWPEDLRVRELPEATA